VAITLTILAMADGPGYILATVQFFEWFSCTP
jgi:hypothetical protein